jgi:hypothetical protein
MANVRVARQGRYDKPKLDSLGPREDPIRLGPDEFVEVRAGRRFTFKRSSEPDLGPYRITSIQ